MRPSILLLIVDCLRADRAFAQARLAPGLVGNGGMAAPAGGYGGGYGYGGGRARSGRWVRRGRKIVVLGA